MANKEDLIWAAQAKTAFVKVYTDWFGIGKFHFSFVKHSGPPNYTQLLSIEGSLAFTAEDGAMALTGFVLSGAAAAASAYAQANKKGDYFDELFKHKGGSSAKDGKPCLYRDITLVPSTANAFGYALCVRQCEGQQNEKGGFMPLQGASYENIIVPVSSNSLFALCKAMEAEYTAYRAVQRLSASAASPTMANTQANAQRVCLLYDLKGHLYSNRTKVVAIGKAVEELQQGITALTQMEQAFQPDNDMYHQAVDLINSGECGMNIVHHTSKNTDDTDGLVVDVQLVVQEAA